MFIREQEKEVMNKVEVRGETQARLHSEPKVLLLDQDRKSGERLKKLSAVLRHSSIEWTHFLRKLDKRKNGFKRHNVTEAK